MKKQELRWIQGALLRISALSPQQLVVLRYLAAGMDNRSIAAIMDRSERTIKAHVSALIERLDVNSRLQLGLVGYHIVLLTNPQLLSGFGGEVPDVLAQGSVQDLATEAMRSAGAEDPYSLRCAVPALASATGRSASTWIAGVNRGEQVVERGGEPVITTCSLGEVNVGYEDMHVVRNMCGGIDVAAG